MGDKVFMQDVLLQDLGLSAFAPWLNTVFRVRQETGEFVELVLVEAKPLEAGGAGRDPRSFQLLFQGPDRFLLPQRMYTFEHDHIGRFALFISPVGKRPGRFEYQAVFNRVA